jgi:hypothetical protein
MRVKLYDTRLRGAIGGKIRALKLTPERRHEIAVAATRARWQTKNEHSGLDAVLDTLYGEEKV